MPTPQNGGVLEGGKIVRWRLKQGVTWHDGKPFTADDCVFTWEYARDPATAAVTSGVYKDVDGRQGRFAHDPGHLQRSRRRSGPRRSCAAEGMMIPKHLFAPYIGAKSRDAPTNLKPVGTGPYKFVDFKPGDMVRGEINNDYHMPNRPVLRHDRDEGRRRRHLGGARRAADRRVRLRLEPAGRRRSAQAHGSQRQGQRPHRPERRHRVHPAQRHRSLDTEVEGERAHVKSKHFAFSDPAGARGDGRCSPTARACRSSSTAAPASRPRTS